MHATAIRRTGWRDPASAAAPFAARPYTLALISDGGPQGRWSYLALDPDRVERIEAADPAGRLRDLLGPRTAAQDGPPFQGGVVGLAAYELGARFEPVDLPRDPDWPDLELIRYPAVLAFDHARGEVLAVGRGADAETAERRADEALQWLAADGVAKDAPSGAPAASFEPEGSGGAYEAAVADVIARIGAGEIFQANVARSWRGRLRDGAVPFDVFRRLLSGSPAPFAAYLALPGRALVSNSPERFLGVRPQDGGLTVEARPIKGTAPRGADPAADAAAADALLASEKDRAENLMIVDLMRNDLARVCAVGSVGAPELFRVETYVNVHHLVSTVRGRLSEGRDLADLFAATFPPGSITGAPKVQAMKVIAAHEPPRGPWCGSLFWAGFDGAFDSSVLIRTAAFVERDGWRFRTSAGAGIVADSDPAAERRETEAKIDALRRALTEGG
ncbi:anthranilate synthase component I family protein [Caulobacter sp. 17J80-11]|uniref:anthranilate synthase component I family protein n=1 Tax=Caulobacter sp. 17J80-11 TaxID=2763502 RepID=UPI0016539FFD|nr:anthranilate synthase component I family protein [Caulobacter sp. 17J80-11]MBC6981642.1 anthranilate synthase component I family protein [Caulobacter sp. 17J80-11]